MKKYMRPCSNYSCEHTIISSRKGVCERCTEDAQEAIRISKDFKVQDKKIKELEAKVKSLEEEKE